MKSLAVGCIGVILGILISGALLIVVGVAVGPSLLQQGVSASPVVVPGQPDVTVAATASYLDTLVQQSLVRGGLVRQATVSLAAPNLVRISTPVEVTALGRPVPVNLIVSMSASAQNGRVVLKIEQVDAGAVNVPQSSLSPQVETLRAQIEQQVNVVVQRLLQGTALRLMNIRATPEALTVDLTRR